MGKKTRSQLWSSASEWWALVPRRWVGVVDMLLALIPLLAGIVGAIWQRNSSEPLPIWIIATLTGGTLLFVILSFSAFHRVRLERDSLREGGPDEIKWAEWRRDYRAGHAPEVTQIPNTLLAMWSLVSECTEQRKAQKRPPQQKLVTVVAELLKIETDDPMLTDSSLASKQKIGKLIKRVKGKMSLMRSNAKLEALWRIRMSSVMDNHKIGLRLEHNPQYVELDEAVKAHGAPISRAAVYRRIDEFLEDLSTLYNLKLFIFFGKTSAKLHLFPRDMREGLARLETRIEKQMRGRFTEVKRVLEEYSIGGELRDEQ